MFDLREQLRRAAREIFDEALASADAGDAVRRAVRLVGSRLTIVDATFDLDASHPAVYAVAVGKAACAMAKSLDEILDDRIARGVLSSATTDCALSPLWEKFAGGHPFPNDASLAAARAASELLKIANERATVAPSVLIVFLISGGGSAMLELPRDEQTTLEELRETNRLLVSCGATIAEINAVRRGVSAVKGGGLAALAPRAAQVTLIVSDTNPGEEANVASGPSLQPPNGSATDAAEVIARYGLASKLPPSILRAIDSHGERVNDAAQIARTSRDADTRRRHFVLLDNSLAVERAAAAARARGYVVEVASDLDEQPVDTGATALVSRLAALRARHGAAGRTVCLISGGEFSCPVRGVGVGGRNSETALRCAVEFERDSAGRGDDEFSRAVALCAGTDGIDGNSPAAGALADVTTVSRARALDMDATDFLQRSDAYTFFDLLGDALVTGPTGTNVRDLRILLKG